MPDIFGRDPGDYEHLRMLDDAGVLETYLADQATAWGNRPHNFDALGSLRDHHVSGRSELSDEDREEIRVVALAVADAAHIETEITAGCGLGESPG